MRLIYKDTGKEVKPGDKVKSFRDELATVVSFSKPHKPSSSGRVLVDDGNGFQHEYYVSVYGMEWVDREDR